MSDNQSQQSSGDPGASKEPSQGYIGQPLLAANDLHTGYGKKQVLNGVTINVQQREVVAVIGHNGAGKSTLLKSLFGILPLWRGDVMIDGQRLDGHARTRVLRQLGVAYVPQGNRVFPGMTVLENLEVAAASGEDGCPVRERIDKALTLFPALKTRLGQRAGSLSGGEKQMLAVAKGLIISPRLLLLDEPSLGLAPPLVRQAFAHIHDLNQASGVSYLIVEQKVRDVLKIADRVYVLRNGAVSFTGRANELEADGKLREVYL